MHAAGRYEVSLGAYLWDRAFTSACRHPAPSLQVQQECMYAARHYEVCARPQPSLLGGQQRVCAYVWIHVKACKNAWIWLG